MRSSFGFDIASNTAYGPLIGHFDFQADLGNGLDPLNGSTRIQLGCLRQRSLPDLGRNHRW